MKRFNDTGDEPLLAHALDYRGETDRVIDEPDNIASCEKLPELPEVEKNCGRFANGDWVPTSC